MVKPKSRRKIRKGGVETRSQRELRRKETLRAELEGLRRGDIRRRTRESAISIAKKMGDPRDVRRLEGEFEDPGAISPDASDPGTQSSSSASAYSGRGRRRTQRRRH